MSADKTKWCNGCQRWLSAREILESPRIIPIGMAFMESGDDEAFYYFLHDVPECGTTFLIAVDSFAPFLTEEVPPDNLHETECCENHCSSVDSLAICSLQCQYAPYRRLLFEMMAAKQRATAPGRDDIQGFLTRVGARTGQPES